MEFNWQTFVALALVLAAGWFLLRRLLAVLQGRRAQACGGCSKCADGEGQKPLVEISDLSKSASRNS